MNSTSFFYAHTDQWRYETLDVERDPLADGAGRALGRRADRLQRARRAHGLAAVGAAARDQSAGGRARQAAAAGMEPKDYVAEALQVGRAAAVLRGSRQPGELAAQPVRLALEPAGLLRQGPRVLPQAPARHHARRAWARTWARTGAQKPSEVVWHDEAPEGKLDLLVTLDFRMSTTCVYSDIVLPTATWYEKNDLNTSDMHPFIHPLTAAVDPVWECAQRLGHLQGDRQEVLRGRAGGARRREGRRAHADPARHARRDRAGARRQGLEEGRVRADPRQDHADGRPWSSATIPNLYKRFTSLGPLMDKLGNGGKGMAWNTEHEVDFLQASSTASSPRRARPRACPHRQRHRRLRGDPARWRRRPTARSRSRPGSRWARLHRARAHPSRDPKEDEKIRFRDVVAQPRKIISSPIWSGLEIGEGLLQRRLHQRPRADPVAHAHRPPAALPGPSVDARLRRGASASTGRRSTRKTVKPVIDSKPNGEKRDRAELHHPAPEVGHPLHLHRQPADADAVSRGGPIVWISEDGRGQGRHRRQRLDRGLQRQRRAGRARGRLPARQAGHVHDVPRAGEDRERAGLGDHRASAAASTTR